MNKRDPNLDAQKLALNIESERQMRSYLKSLTWEQKVASVERMNKADKIAKQAMRDAMQAERNKSDSVS